MNDGRMRRLPIIRDYMDRKLRTLSADTDIHEAIKFLLRHGISSALVVDDAGLLVGLLSEKDCLKLVVEGVEGDTARGTVGQFMTSEVETISPDLDIYYVAGMFLKRTFRRFPVVEHGKLVGHITRRDILRIVRGLHDRA